MDSERIKDLLEKQKTGNLSAVEQMILETWYIRLSQDETANINHVDMTRRLNLVRDNLKFNNKQEHKIQRLTLVRISAAIAAVIAFVITSIFLFNALTHSNPSKTTLLENDIAPGKFGATLTLSSGKKLKLTNVVTGTLAEEAGVVITKSETGSLIYELKGSTTEPNKRNTLSTANGETYQLRLPDGSLVWLNSSSSITYTTSLYNEGFRRVTLEGEAYFEVFKDKTHPFIVEVAGQKVQVLGTHFNINSYADESSVNTTLVEGSVKVIATNGNQQTIKPGEVSILRGNILKIQPANVLEAIAWKNGYFRFNDENIRSVMRKISRWYNVEVHFNNSKSVLALNGTIVRSKNLSQILAVLESTQAVHFKIEGRRITVME